MALSTNNSSRLKKWMLNKKIKKILLIFLAALVVIVLSAVSGGVTSYLVQNSKGSSGQGEEPNIPKENKYDNATGEFNSSAARTFSSQSRFSQWMRFEEPFIETPSIALGLWKLDISRGSSTIGVNTLARNISSRGFTVHVESTRDTIINEVALHWMAVPSAIPKGGTDYQTGRFGILDVRPREDTLHKQNNLDIKFSRPYSLVPNVILWIDSFDFAVTSSWRIHTYPTNIRPQGFTANLDSWADTALYSANVSWIAWPSTTRSVIGNYISPEIVPLNTTGPDAGWGNTTNVSFSNGVVSRTFPQVLSAFSKFDVKRGDNMKILISNNVRSDGMECSFKSFGNVTLSNNAGIAWIAAT